MARPSNLDVLRKAAGEIANEVVIFLKDELGIALTIDQQITLLTRLRDTCDRLAANGSGGEKKGGEA